MKAFSDIVVLVFVVSSVLSIGVQLTVSQVLAPLRDVRTVMTTLIVNFVVTPALAIAICRLFGLEESQSIGLILLGAAAGAPFLPKLVEAGKGDLALATSIMVLLMIGSLAYLPLILPVMLPGVTVNSYRIGLSLVTTMIVPLVVGLSLKAQFESLARWLLPVLSGTSNLTLIVALLLIPVMNASEVLGIMRSRGIFAGLLFIAIAYGCGYLLSPALTSRSVIGLATASRNIPAALLIGTQNFHAGVTTMVIVMAIVSLVVLLPITIQNRRSYPLPS